MPGMYNGMKVIMLNPRETAGVAFVKKMGGLHLDILPGTDLLVMGAITRVILGKRLAGSRVDRSMGE